MATRKKSSGSQGGKVGCLFILLAFCVGLLVFLANIGKIRATLDRTNFTEIMKTQKDQGEDKTAPVSPAPKVKDEPAPVSKSADPTAVPSASAPSAQAPASSTGAKSKGSQVPEASARQPADAGSSQDKSSSQAKDVAKPEAAGKSAGTQTAPVAKAPAQKTRQALLYFVRIDDDGVIARQEVSRQIPASDQPLTDALAALLAGPSEAELRRSLISLIPSGTKLLSVQVRGSTAVLNFNEAFMYNHYGIEGYAGQLKQVVYTATAFSSVQDVQVLIEGERHDYLGGEGVYIGRPLSRNSF